MTAPTAEEVLAARGRATPVGDYLTKMSKLYRWKFAERKKSYQPNVEVLSAITERAADFFVVAFSAQWCEDCSQHLPVLALISEGTGLEVRVFGKIKKDPLAKDSLWRIPPSPPEVLTFGLEKLPLILLYDQQGVEVGRISENPAHTGTVEEELQFLIAGPG